MNQPRPSHSRPARGVATVEFALTAILFFTLLFSALEFARLLYVYNSLQEVTRRAAREATVRWTSEEAAVKSLALFGAGALPGGAEITSSNIQIEYLNAGGTASSPQPDNASDNLSACGDATRAASCIYSVKVSIVNVRYIPMLSIFGFLDLSLPSSSVTMHSESMGFEAS